MLSHDFFFFIIFFFFLFHFASIWLFFFLLFVLVCRGYVSVSLCFSNELKAEWSLISTHTNAAKSFFYWFWRMAKANRQLKYELISMDLRSSASSLNSFLCARLSFFVHNLYVFRILCCFSFAFISKRIRMERKADILTCRRTKLDHYNFEAFLLWSASIGWIDTFRIHRINSGFESPPKISTVPNTVNRIFLQHFVFVEFRLRNQTITKRTEIHRFCTQQMLSFGNDKFYQTHNLNSTT